jgi:hypothetical protein
MANSLKKLAQVQLGSSDGVIYTAPADVLSVTVVALYITNTDTSDRTFRIHQVNAAGASLASNALYYDKSLATKDTKREPAGIILEPDQMLRGLASVAAVVTVTVFGIESRA